MVRLLDFSVFAALVVGLACVDGTARAQQSFNPMYWINTPGARSFIEGSAHYGRGNYRTAYARFHYAALWADKRAQYNLGVMNVSGQVGDMPEDTGLPCAGMGAPGACGWAWLELSAERGYPQFRRRADEVWARLGEDQRRLGRRLLREELEPRYGDDARRELTSLRMNTRRMRNSGVSRVGYNYYTGLADGQAWDFERIVEYETRLYRALDRTRVELRELELNEEAPERDDDETAG